LIAAKTARTILTFSCDIARAVSRAGIDGGRNRNHGGAARRSSLPEAGGWYTAEVEDGAEALFPWLVEK
jgi:hypothetical protein